MKALLTLFACTLFLLPASAVDVPRTKLKPRPPAAEEILASPRDGSRLLLQAGVFDPTRESLDFEAVGLPRLRVLEKGAAAPAARYAIVQFEPGMMPARDELAGLGVEPMGYLPDNAFQVRLDAASRERLEARADVRWIGDYDPGYKVSPRLWPGTKDAPHEVVVVVFPGESPDVIFAGLVSAFPQALRTHSLDDPVSPALRIAVPQSIRDAFVVAASRIEGVRWIEPYDEPVLHNIDASGPIQGNQTGSAGRTLFARGLTGTGQIAAVADSGLDSDMCFFRSLNGVEAVTLATDTPYPSLGPLFPDRKVIGYWVQPGAQAYDDDMICRNTPTGFHGTHVAGTVAGDNRATPSSPSSPGIDSGDGMAPNAQILFQDVGNLGGCLAGLGNKAAMFAQALAGGARVHSNSYGSDSNGNYSSDDQSADRFLFDHEEMSIVYSAGNSGPASTSIGSPGVSKNVVTVGALGHGDNTVIARFSSRGPTVDGRIKPDIVAPGSSVGSAAGDTVQGNDNCGISFKSGTSMAAPTVAGGAVLLRQYFADGFYPTGSKNAADALEASAALVKATLLNGTLALPSGQTFGDLAYGWGRIFLDGNLYFAGDSRKLRAWNLPNIQGIRTGDVNSYTVDVRTGQELRVTLVWSDAEGTLGAAAALVNDLDLSVVDPSGTTFLGNSFSTAGVSVTGGSPDRTNNVEQVRFTAPAAGTYTVRVAGASVPGTGRASTDRQGYALVVSAATCDSGVTAPPANVTGSSNPSMGVDLHFDAPAGSKVTQVYRVTGTCAAPAGAFQYAGLTTGSSFTDARAQGGVTYSYKLRGADDCGEGPVSSCVTVTPTGRCDIAPTFEGIAGAAADGANCRIVLQWPEATSNCALGQTVRYNVYRATSPDMAGAFAKPYATVTGATSYDDIDIASGVTYYYSVRAEDSVTGAGGPNGGNEEKNRVSTFATATGPAGSTIGTWTDDGGDTSARMLVTSPWQITATEAQSGPYSYHSGPDDGFYPRETCAAITTPELALDSGAVLTYFARYNLEFNWDGVVVEISTDGGSTWTDLPPSSGYPGTLSETLNPPINACGYPSTRGAFTGPPANDGLTPWTSYSSSLAAFAGQSVKIRWRLTTDPGLELEGFFLDSISVTSVRLPSECARVIVTPVASFDFSPRAPLAGTAVAFTDTSSNEPASRLWNFGDGSTSTEPNPSHVFATPALRTVKLTVTNAAGTSEAMREITIGDPAASFQPKQILPGQARAAGAGGSFFRTSMWLTNPGLADSVVRLRYVPTGTAGGAEETSFVTIRAGRSVAFQDVLADAFGASENTSGAIVVEVESGRPAPVVTSRTFNDAGAIGTFGQYIPAIAIAPPTGASEARLEGLGGDVANRSNVGVLNLSATPLDAEISVRGADGAPRGTSVPVQVPAYGVVQVNGANFVAGAGAMPVFTAVVNGNGRFYAYASKLDNLTSDPIFIPGTLTPRASQFVDGVGSLVGANNTLFKSNLSLTNRNASESVVTIGLTPRGATAPVATQTVALPPFATRYYDDAVAEIFGFQGAASLHLATGASVPVAAWARTYSDRGASGTLGQFIPAFSAEDLIGTGGAILQGLSQTSRYRTNAGLVNVSAAPVNVRVEVRRGDGTSAGEKVYPVAGGQSVFVAQIILDVTGAELADGYLRVEPAAPGAIYAWASFVDNLSTDQTFVRPIPME